MENAQMYFVSKRGCSCDHLGKDQARGAENSLLSGTPAPRGRVGRRVAPPSNREENLWQDRTNRY